MTEKVFLYGEVDLPPIPEELIIAAGAPTIYQDSKDMGYGLTHIKDGNRLEGLAYKGGSFTYPPLIKWLRDNRIPGAGNSNEVIMQIQSPGTHIVHSDVKRVYALNYVVDTGGEDVITSWYQEKNMPLRRSKDIGWKQADTGAVKYDDLDLLSSIKFEKNKWYLLSVDILHDVGIITGTRKCVSYSFFDHSILPLIQKLNLLKSQND